jgi:hypothetical protein
MFYTAELYDQVHPLTLSLIAEPNTSQDTVFFFYRQRLGAHSPNRGSSLYIKTQCTWSASAAAQPVEFFDAAK